MSEVVDARWLRCPLPVIRLAAAARSAVPGSMLTVWATDPAAKLDIPAWARMRGHEVVGQMPLAGELEPRETERAGETELAGEAEFAITVRLGGA